jgi:hypothetical protein
LLHYINIRHRNNEALVTILLYLVCFLFEERILNELINLWQVILYGKSLLINISHHKVLVPDQDEKHE